jgi:hypothetical protein
MIATMRFSILSFPVIQLLFLQRPVLALPSSSLHDLFTHPDVPVLGELDPSLFNLTSFNDHRDVAPSKRAINLPYVLYNINMDGRSQGNWENFFVGGQMVIAQGVPSSATQNGPNPYDVIIFIGSPNVNPIAGSIRYATNRYLYRLIGGAYSNSLLDFDYITVQGNRVGVTVDTRIAAANQLSNFNARSGLTANVYIVSSGGFAVTLGTTSLSGVINVVGTGYIFPGQAPYKAVISGTMVGRGTASV